MLDVPRLRVLRTVVAKGSVRAAAAALDYTPSAVSQQLTSLQRETGLRLVERVGRGIEPTAAARVLAAEAESLFQALSRVEGLVRDLRDGRTGSLSIGYLASAGATWLPEVVATLLAEFPRLRIDLRLAEPVDTQRAETDLALFIESPGRRPPELTRVCLLAQDPYFVVVRESDPLAGLARVPLAALAERGWIDNELENGPCRQVLLSACAEAGFCPRFTVETHDYRTAITFAGTGIGITVVPGLGIGRLPEGLVARPVVEPVPVRRVCVAIREAVAEHPATLRALELLRSAVASDPPGR
ncbi:DNA-binding transcriptional LysR family regulator [Saccharomonospora amisosensis]|uniref:DNA-binding transcriptional LysR family regulator n=1 Tax=Saccharomonospora amisosensis TaxID=1128677 RepID=A0A7X5UPC4_9PSEU|nr:LysR family transcriptional regulator [Saccharomonospora amisosensis]NIJ11705.1 DNA-binding transcriptional LysR family regulator [Saccharomonospora amisosensis]